MTSPPSAPPSAKPSHRSKPLNAVNVDEVGSEIHIRVCARSFLHHQVRSMAGSLKLVGEGKWRKHDLVQALAAKDRAACGTVAPPEGLYLARVDYPRNTAPTTKMIK